MRPLARVWRVVAALSIVASAGGLLGAGPPASSSSRTLNVFAAASLADAFAEIARDFESAHAGVSVRLNLAGSQQLVAQIEQGAGADVFASADTRWMDQVVADSLVAGEVSTFARNRLVAIVPRTNPARIARLQDLSRPGVKLVLGAEAVPVGRYSREALQNLSKLSGFDASFALRTLTNVVSEEENVKAVVGKVQLGEADAGICYRSDVTPAVKRFIRVIEIPADANVIATYPIAVLAGATRSELARPFVELVLSAAGQRALEKHGLIPIAAQTP